MQIVADVLPARHWFVGWLQRAGEFSATEPGNTGAGLLSGAVAVPSDAVPSNEGPSLVNSDGDSARWLNDTVFAARSFAKFRAADSSPGEIGGADEYRFSGTAATGGTASGAHMTTATSPRVGSQRNQHAPIRIVGSRRGVINIDPTALAPEHEVQTRNSTDPELQLCGSSKPKRSGIIDRSIYRHYLSRPAIRLKAISSWRCWRNCHGRANRSFLSRG